MTRAPHGRDGLIAQLRTLLLLTNREIAVVTQRQAQASTDGIRWELARNARDAAGRGQRIEAELHRLGGVPDIVTPAAARVGALMNTVTSQVETPADALFDDLMGQHQLLDRVAYLRASATAAGEQDVITLADLLLTAHSEIVAWLTTVLAQEAVGAPAALQPTLLQTAAGVAARVAGAPLRWGATGVDRAAARTLRPDNDVQSSVIEANERATTVAGGVTDTVAVRGEGLATVIPMVRRDGSRRPGKTVHHARIHTHCPVGVELSVPHYDTLTATQVASATQRLPREGLQAVLRYEQARKNRSTVITAVQRRMRRLGASGL